MTLIENLFHIDTWCFIADFDIDLLLEEHIVCDLVIHRLRNTIFRQIVLGEKMVNVASVFQHSLHVNLCRQETSVVALYLCNKEHIKVRAACDRSVQALYKVDFPKCI